VEEAEEGEGREGGREEEGINGVESYYCLALWDVCLSLIAFGASGRKREAQLLFIRLTAVIMVEG